MEPKVAAKAEDVKIYPTTVPVPANHRLLQLKRALDWERITEIVTDALRQAGRNVDGTRPGRRLTVGFYPQLLVLMLVLQLDLRKMEAYLAENAVGRRFIGLETDPCVQVRDHSTIGRLIESLGSDGFQQLNRHINQEAVRLGFAQADILSADTTTQELAIGYPHEAGILRGVAERFQRAYNALKKQGKKKLEAINATAQEVIHKCKEYHLFAKTRERKDRILHQMVRLTQKMVTTSEAVSARFANSTQKRVVSALKTLNAMQDVSGVLLPQILSWLKTGIVARGKILHPGLSAARAMVRNKVGKKVEFGLQYLIGAVRGGYLMASLISKPTGESKMPRLALAMYRDTFGPRATPDLFVYDRGGSSRENVQMLREEGVRRIGIQPKGRARLHVPATDRKLVARERATMEGKIGTLKAFYRMNKPRERRADTVFAVGPRSVLGFNLNKFTKDVIARNASAA